MAQPLFPMFPTDEVEDELPIPYAPLEDLLMRELEGGFMEGAAPAPTIPPIPPVKKHKGRLFPSVRPPTIPEAAREQLGPQGMERIQDVRSEQTYDLLRNLALIATMFAPAASLGFNIFSQMGAGERGGKEADIERALQGETLSQRSKAAEAKAKQRRMPQMGTSLRAQLAMRGIINDEDFFALSPQDQMKLVAEANAAVREQRLEELREEVKTKTGLEEAAMRVKPFSAVEGYIGKSFLDRKTGEMVPPETPYGSFIKMGARPLSPAQESAFLAAKTIEQNVGLLTNALLLTGKLPKDEVHRLVKGPENIAEIILQSDDTLVGVKAAFRAMGSRLARAFGEVGNLSRQDVVFALAILPKVTDTEPVVRKKAGMLKFMMQDFRYALAGKIPSMQETVARLKFLTGKNGIDVREAMADAEAMVNEIERTEGIKIGAGQQSRTVPTLVPSQPSVPGIIERNVRRGIEGIEATGEAIGIGPKARAAKREKEAAAAAPAKAPTKPATPRFRILNIKPKR